MTASAAQARETRGAIADQLIQLSRDHGAAVDKLGFGPPVAHVYNPLNYARELHEAYLGRFGGRPGRILLLGMNPGPWGMAQTGVPFGEVSVVRDWMKLSGEVKPYCGTHPKRPIQGLNCRRSEVSGQRLWGWAAAQFGTPESFFKTHFVLNYCPLLFLLESGANLTPDKLSVSERNALTAVCDRALRQYCDALVPKIVVGVGGFAAKRAETALAGTGIKIGQVLHPSPASPAANRGWAAEMTRQMAQWAT